MDSRSGTWSKIIVLGPGRIVGSLQGNEIMFVQMKLVDKFQCVVRGAE